MTGLKRHFFLDKSDFSAKRFFNAFGELISRHTVIFGHENTVDIVLRGCPHTHFVLSPMLTFKTTQTSVAETSENVFATWSGALLGL